MTPTHLPATIRAVLFALGVFFYACVFPLATHAQGIFMDDFTDGNFNQNPVWSGNTTAYTVNTAKQLQLSVQPAATGTAYLSTAAATADSTVWEFWFKMNFAPSDNNNLRIYLASDNANLSASLNGYFIRAGENLTNDALKLYRKNGAAETLILTATTLGAIANAPAQARVRVVRNAKGVWKFYADYAGGTNYQTEGTTTDTTALQGTYFGVMCKYTSSNVANFFFDDFRIAPLHTDVTPPALSAATALDSLHLDALFSEPLDPIAANNPVHYSISNGFGAPTTATIDGTNARLVHLGLSTPLTTNNYTLTATNIADVVGNVAPALTANFNYTQIGVPNEYDILINEIMADPDPPVGLPNQEYVELYNRSNKTFDLAAFRFSDAVDTVALPSFIFAPNSYVLVCKAANVPLYTPIIGAGKVVGVPVLPSLNNTGDDLTLYAAPRRIIHHVSYTTAWYGSSTKANGGWSLELRNAATPCKGSDNWVASTDASGGTPARQNSVYTNIPDTQAPTATLTVLSATTVKIAFSEAVTNADATVHYHLTTNGANLSPANVVINAPDSVTLAFATPFADSAANTLTIDGVTDCSGNATANLALPFTFRATFEATEREVIINEIFPDPTPAVALPPDEYLELYNRGSRYLHINFTLRIGSKTYPVQSPTPLPPNGYAILTKTGNGADFAAFGQVVEVPFSSLVNTGDTLVLRTANGGLLDAVAYTDAWYGSSAKAGGGWSLERISPEILCLGSENWTASTDPSGGTPARRNAVFRTLTDTEAPALVRAFAVNANQVRLFFSKGIAALTAADCAVTDANGIPLAVQTATIEQPFDNTTLLTFAAPLQPATIYTVLLATTVRDCSGNAVAAFRSAHFGLAELPQAGDVVINEILFNPRTYGVDFVELYNRSSKVINLNGCAMANADDGGNIATVQNITTDFLLLPQSYAVVTPDRATIVQQYFVPNPDAVLEMTLPTYPDKYGTVVVLNNGVEIDRVAYSSDWHSALLHSQQGVSLERISPAAASQNPASWHSAATTVGYATPTYRNSEAIDGGVNTPTAPDFVLQNDIFSPNGDGYRDFALLDYRLDRAGWVASATVYDAAGREMRKLLENAALDTVGTLQWDGATTDGRKAAVGIYIFFVRLLHPDGSQKEVRRTVVLGGQ